MKSNNGIVEIIKTIASQFMFMKLFSSHWDDNENEFVK
jgi:hypothetical protein